MYLLRLWPFALSASSRQDVPLMGSAIHFLHLFLFFFSHFTSFLCFYFNTTYRWPHPYRLDKVSPHCRLYHSLGKSKVIVWLTQNCSVRPYWACRSSWPISPIPHFVWNSIIQGGYGMNKTVLNVDPWVHHLRCARFNYCPIVSTRWRRSVTELTLTRSYALETMIGWYSHLQRFAVSNLYIFYINNCYVQTRNWL